MLPIHVGLFNTQQRLKPLFIKRWRFFYLVGMAIAN